MKSHQFIILYIQYINFINKSFASSLHFFSKEMYNKSRNSLESTTDSQ